MRGVGSNTQRIKGWVELTVRGSSTQRLLGGLGEGEGKMIGSSNTQ